VLQYDFNWCFKGAKVNVQEAFVRVGELGYYLSHYLTVLFMKRNRSSMIKLDAAFCFCLCVCGETPTTHPETPHWSCKENGVSVMRTGAVETFRRILPEIRNLLRSLWGVRVWQSTTSHMYPFELKQAR